jgi:phage shock protein C
VVDTNDTETHTTRTGPESVEHRPESPPQLRRSRQDRVLAGVCGGLGRYLNVDPVILRIVMVALIFAGVGIPAYIIAWLVIPEEGESEPAMRAVSSGQTVLIAGTALIALGGLLLLRPMMPWMHQGVFWPLVVVAGGIVLVVTARR